MPAVMVKISPDEDSEAQVTGICEAVQNSGCAGVIVGNTTKRRPDPLPAGYSLPEKEAMLMLEQGGYSGPQLFERTVALVRRYREILDKTSPSNSRSIAPSQPSTTPQSSQTSHVADQIQATVERDRANLKPTTPEADADSKSQPLIRLPDRNSPSSPSPSASITSPGTPPDSPPALSSSSHLEQLPSTSSPDTASSSRISPDRKVIFATGGIQNGRQALEVLEAGASVAMVYTALVYGGVSKFPCLLLFIPHYNLAFIPR